MILKAYMKQAECIVQYIYTLLELSSFSFNYIRTAFFTVHRDVDKEQKMITTNRQTKRLCSGADLSKIVGLELCGELEFPNASMEENAPYFPLTGPVNMGLTLYKRDAHTGYRFQAKSIHVSKVK